MLLAQAKSAGAGIEIMAVRHADDVDADSLFLATGKHDLRGLARPKPETDDPTLGLRVKIAAHPRLSALIGSSIELHLFDRGYVGLLLQEDGRANLCLAVRKSRLAEAGASPSSCCGSLVTSCHRLASDWRFWMHCPTPKPSPRCPMAGARPERRTACFAWAIKPPSSPRLPAKATASPSPAASRRRQRMARGGAPAAPGYQRDFARRTRRPVALAKWLWERGETQWSAALATRMLAHAPIDGVKTFARA